MPALPLPLVGWLYTLGCAIALLAGAWLVIALHRQGEDVRRQLARGVLEDTVLFGIWILGFAGGVGVLLEQPWSRPLLEFFCWVLAVLTLFSAYSRLRARRDESRPMLVLSILLFVFPILALCGATILTLRGEEALRLLSGG